MDDAEISQDSSDAGPKPRRNLKGWQLACAVWSQFFIAGIFGSIFVYALINHVLSWLGIIVGALLVSSPLWCAAEFIRKRGPRPLGIGRWIALILLVVVAAAFARPFWPDSRQWRPYTFEDQLAAIEADRRIPDAEDAALAYEKLLTDPNLNQRRASTLFAEYPVNPGVQPWNRVEYPGLAARLGVYDDTLARLDHIAQIDQCRFPVSVRPFESIPEHVRPMCNLTWLLVAEANADLGQGNLDEAMARFETVFQVARHLRQQWQLLDYIGALGSERQVYQCICTLVLDHYVTDDQLAVLDDFVARDNRVDGELEGYFRVSQLRACNVAGLSYETDAEGRVRFSRSYWTTMGATLTESMDDRQLAMLADEAEAMPAWEQRGWAFFIAMSSPYHPKTAGRIIEDAYASYTPLANADPNLAEIAACSESCTRALRRLAGLRMSVSIYRDHPETIFECKLKHLAVKRAARILIHARMYKNAHAAWPESLDQIASQLPPETLVDPYYSGRLGYISTPDGIYIYSTGPDGIDQGDIDTYLSKNADGFWCDDRPIWPARKQIMDRVDAMQTSSQQ